MIAVSEERKRALLRERIEECYGPNPTGYSVSYEETKEGLVAFVRWNNSATLSKFVWEKNNYGQGYIWARKSDD